MTSSIDEENASARRAGHADPETSSAESSHLAEQIQRASCVEQRLGVHCDSEDEARQSIGTTSIPKSPSTTIDSDESFQCRGLQYDPEQRWSNPIPREPIVWASGSRLGHRRSIPASPGTVASDSDESFQCRGLQWQHEPGFRQQESISASGSRSSRRGGGHSRNISTSPEAVDSDSDESFQCRGLSFQSWPDFGSQKSVSRVSARDSDESFQCRGLSYQSQPDFGSPVDDSISRASVSDSDESFHCRGLSYQSLSDLRRPDPLTQAPSTRTSAGGIAHKNPAKGKNFLGLRLDLSSISNFQLKENRSNRRQDSTENQALNQRIEVQPLASPIVASPPPPINSAETPLRKAGIPILGSSKLRTLKLERKNRRKGPLQGIKTALKKILRVPKKD
ncbi:uncharacterized protein PGTG_00835 [Puccinia graminis f. sp. tritici CRL 75-36-700-3]|uniref:Uncharacterized protein n=2 Tax=Puccinia graminis f. sp. tritici TaxID=56615 RepID=E3JTY3_PUCGT|nr:uncharacterized protein PGTG_00835 [Puccinia graminis f. sp. tritici CRL 75-36-700-3]EFP75504.2 hypothetical protein PGTG_00835 [Puccinia graminis f. sp. tritici CRL 75-36-700-3]